MINRDIYHRFIQSFPGSKNQIFKRHTNKPYWWLSHNFFFLLPFDSGLVVKTVKKYYFQYSLLIPLLVGVKEIPQGCIGLMRAAPLWRRIRSIRSGSLQSLMVQFSTTSCNAWASQFMQGKGKVSNPLKKDEPNKLNKLNVMHLGFHLPETNKRKEGQ